MWGKIVILARLAEHSSMQHATACMSRDPSLDIHKD